SNIVNPFGVIPGDIGKGLSQVGYTFAKPASLLGIGAMPMQGGGGQAQMDNFLSMYPEYTPGYDPETMSMTKRMQELDPSYSKGLEAFRAEALRKGQSGWLSASKLANDLNEKTLKERGALEASGQVAKAK